jgi:hypothetical protein
MKRIKQKIIVTFNKVFYFAFLIQKAVIYRKEIKELRLLQRLLAEYTEEMLQAERAEGKKGYEYEKHENIVKLLEAIIDYGNKQKR